MGNNPQGIRVSIPPAPTKGSDVLSWASGLVKWLSREMPSFGQGLSSAYQPNRMVKLERPERLPWQVYYLTPTSFGVAAGSLQIQGGEMRTTYDGYTETISATRYIYAKYDRGDVDAPSTPVWVTVSESGGTRYFATGASLPLSSGPLVDRYSYIHIATVNFSGGRITSIDQKIIGAVIPCPDLEVTGTVKQFSVPYGTKIYGWQKLTTAEDRVLVGSSATKASGSTGGSVNIPFQTTAVQSGSGTTVVNGQTGDSLNPYIAMPVYVHL